jgi:hypothetical protein
MVEAIAYVGILFLILAGIGLALLKVKKDRK